MERLPFKAWQRADSMKGRNMSSTDPYKKVRFEPFEEIDPYEKPEGMSAEEWARIEAAHLKTGKPRFLFG